MSALRCLELENKTQSIPTSSQHLDEALGGGVCLGCITEITGLSGSGKTQFCIQLTINTLLPLSINGEVVFISTTRSFCPQRVNELIDNRVKSFQTKNKNKPGSSKKTFTRDDALKKIHYRMVVELDDLIRTVYCLKRFTESNKNIRLIVIDSFSSFLRDLEPLDRIRVMYELLNVLEEIATRNPDECAVVLTNHLTTNFYSFSPESAMKPALGDAFYHRMHQRILLTKTNKETVIAHVQKNISQGPSQVRLRITKDGIKDA